MVEEDKMNADEIVRIDEAVKALHRLSELLVTPDSRVCCEAADLIESLQAQHKQAALNYQQKCRDVVELEAQLAKYDAFAADYGIDGKTMLTLAKSQIKTAQDNIKLQEQLAASQRRERAAVEDIKRVPQVWPCYACKHTGQMSDRCHYDDRDCFEWRGVEAGEESR